MVIERIRMTNFKSFYGEHSIDFTDLHGLWRVGGSVGSGKTSIGEAILFTLFGTVSGKTNKDLISWGEKKSLCEIDCVCRGRKIHIRRENNAYGQSPVSATVDGEEILFTNKKDAQSRLEEEYFDISRNIMELLCVISFNNFKSLSTLNTKDTREFLNTVLGLDVLGKYSSITNEMINEARSDQRALQTKVDLYNSQIDRADRWRDTQDDPVDESEIKDEIRSIEEDIKKKESEVNPKISDLTNEISRLRNESIELVTLGKQKKTEINLISHGVCPTCGAPIDQSSIEKKMKERDALLSQWKTVSDRLKNVEGDLKEVQQVKNEYTQVRAGSISNLKTTLARAAEQRRLRERDDIDREQTVRDRDEASKDLRSIEGEITGLKELYEIFDVDVKQQILNKFIPSINAKMKELTNLLGAVYTPVYDSLFSCAAVAPDGTEVPMSSLSTGQMKLVDMVIILGILRSIMGKVQCNIIFLDELFSNLDNRSRQSLVEVLRVILPEDTAAFIVSHQDMDEEMFDGQVNIKMSNKRSTIEISKKL